MAGRASALHAELTHVLPADGGDWQWELVVTPVSRPTMTRIILADAVHDRLVPVTEWLGERSSRIAHRAQDVTVWAEIKLASYIHVRYRRGDGVRLTVDDEQATALDPQLTEAD